MFLSRFHNYLLSVPLRWGLCVPVCIGAGIAFYFNLSALPSVVLVSLIAVVGFVAAMLAWRVEELHKIGSAVFLLCLGFVAAHCQTTFAGTSMIKYDVGVRTVTGRITNIEPQDNFVRVYFDTINIEKLPTTVTPYSVRFSYRLKDSLPPIGTTVSCRANIKPIAQPVLPGGYDFRQHYYFERIGVTGFIVAPCTVLQAASHNGIALATAEARNSLRTTIRSHLQGDEAAITEALLTGVQEGISDTTMNAMRISGLMHILSVSGLHIGLAAGIVFFMLRALLALFPFIALRCPIKKWAAVAAMLSAWGYTFFVGAPIPAVRSCLMITLALMAVLVDRQALTLRTVALAACVILLLFPASLLSPSFQLSFAAVASIIAVIEATEAWRMRVMADRNTAIRAAFYLGGTAAVALVASIATLPFTYYHFQQINLYGVIANMLADPLAAFWLMPLAVLVLLLAPLGLAEYPLILLGQGVAWLIDIATNVAALPGSDWIVPAMPFAAFTCLVFGGLWLLVWRGAVRWIGVMILFLSLPFIALHEKPRALIDGQGKFIAFAHDNGYALIASGKVRDDNFVLQQWQRYLGVREWLPASAVCDATACFDGKVDYLLSTNALVDACDGGIPFVLLAGQGPQRCPALIDSTMLRRNGAYAINANGLENVADTVGYWPWRQ